MTHDDHAYNAAERRGVRRVLPALASALAAVFVMMGVLL